ncbi:PASTA domain-containing protein [Streptomyces sp. URMC 129]|uniref:excalibur calcium-binding domain-containing protein n=1 Tax=Streptomyces sp. URMC 129 TaxID=3423407 RepID=UPI003F1C5CE0
MHVPNPPPPRPAWRHPALLITALVLLPPVGIVLVWRSGWPRRKKIIAAVVSGVWFALILFTPSEDEQPDDEPRAEPRRTARIPDLTGRDLASASDAADDAGFRSTSHDATDEDAGQWVQENWSVCFQSPAAGTEAAPDTVIDFAVVRDGTPCPPRDGAAVPHPEVPGVLGLPFADAESAMREVELTGIEAESAYTDVPLPAEHDDWVVCFQHPAEGEKIQHPDTVDVTLSLTAPATDCPTTEGTDLHPDPPTTDDEEAGNEDDGGYVYYEDCAAARAANAAPLHRHDPGYRDALDGDDDGIACDT